MVSKVQASSSSPVNGNTLDHIKHFEFFISRIIKKIWKVFTIIIRSFVAWMYSFLPTRTTPQIVMHSSTLNTLKPIQQVQTPIPIDLSLLPTDREYCGFRFMQDFLEYLTLKNSEDPVQSLITRSILASKNQGKVDSVKNLFPKIIEWEGHLLIDSKNYREYITQLLPKKSSTPLVKLAAVLLRKGEEIHVLFIDARTPLIQYYDYNLQSLPPFLNEFDNIHRFAAHLEEVFPMKEEAVIGQGYFLQATK